jgi:hypothetical protein
MVSLYFSTMVFGNNHESCCGVTTVRNWIRKWDVCRCVTLSVAFVTFFVGNFNWLQAKPSGIDSRQAMYVLLIYRRVSAIIVAVGKAVSDTYSEWVFVAFCIQHAMPMLRIVLSYVACPAVQCFSTFSHKRHGFRKIQTKFLNVKCYEFLYNVWNIFHYKKNWTRYDKNVFRSSCKVHVVVRF